MNRNLKIAFTLSLLLNVMLLGVVVSWGYRHLAERPVVATPLKPELSHDIARHMVKARREHESLHQDLKAARQSMTKVLSAPEFSEDDFGKAAQAIDQAQQALSKARSQALLDMAKNMSAEDRQQMARQMDSRRESLSGQQGRREAVEKLRERLKERRSPSEDRLLPVE